MRGTDRRGNSAAWDCPGLTRCGSGPCWPAAVRYGRATALESGLAANLAGGTHHAFADHAEGFCVLNDVAVAIMKLRAEDRIDRALIVDLMCIRQRHGIHLREVKQVFTFSMHGERNYPAQENALRPGCGLADGMGDADYLALLRERLTGVLECARPDVTFYLAGVDVAAGDRYGKLALSEEGIRLRDRYVIESVRSRGIPLVVVLGGGYAATRERTAELHAQVFREAVAYERAGRIR